MQYGLHFHAPLAHIGRYQHMNDPGVDWANKWCARALIRLANEVRMG